MARSLAAPIVTRIQGAVRDVVFRETQGGLVVQGKGVPPVHTTPAAQAVKADFRTAMAAWSRFNEPMAELLRRLAREHGQATTQDWVSAWRRWSPSGTDPGSWALRHVDRRDPAPVFEGGVYLTFDQHLLIEWEQDPELEDVLPAIVGVNLQGQLIGQGALPVLGDVFRPNEWRWTGQQFSQGGFGVVMPLYGPQQGPWEVGQGVAVYWPHP